MSTPSQTGATSPPPISPTGEPLAPGSGATEQFSNTFARTYYASRPPAFQPFYWGRPGVPVPEGQSVLTPAQYIALVKQMIQSPPIHPVTQKTMYMIELIEVFGWDPLTTMDDAINNGDGHFPPAGGFVQGNDAPGIAQNAGPLAEGQRGTNVSVNLADYPAWPAAEPVTPPTVSDQVGVSVYGTGPYYEVIGTNPPQTETDYRGTFDLYKLPSPFMISTGGYMLVYKIRSAA